MPTKARTRATRANAKKTTTTTAATTPAKTEKVAIEDLNDGDEIFIEDKWRKFALAAESLTVKNGVNIMVKNTNKRFFRVKEDVKIERKVKEDKS